MKASLIRHSKVLKEASMKKTVKMFALTAAAVLGLGLSQARAAEAAAPAQDGGHAVQAAAPVVAEGSALGGSGLLAQPTPVSTRPQMDGVSDAFLAAIGKGDGGNGFIPVCVDNGCWSCCYTWTTGWICADICG